MLPERMNMNSSSSTSESEFIPDRTLISHTHTSRQLPPSSESNSDELRNRAQISQRDADEDSSSSRFSTNSIAESEDLLTQIFVHLPARSVMLFQFFSNIWRSIISNRYFRDRRFKPIRTGAYFLFENNSYGNHLNFVFRSTCSMTWTVNFISNCEEYTDSMRCTVSDLTKNFDVSRLLGFHSCNGLVAIALKSNDLDGIDFYAYNPTTRSRRHIPWLYVHQYDPKTNQLVPPVSCPQTCTHFVALNMVFDPSQSGKYKLIYIWRDGEYVRFACYASDTQVWTASMWFIDEEYDMNYHFEKGVFWNGNFYWCTSWWTILCFDLENGTETPITAEILGVVVPQEKAFWPEVFCFGLCGEDLCLSGLTYPNSWLFRIFNLELDHSRWNLKYCFSLSPLLTLYPNMDIEDQNGYDRWWTFHKFCP